MDPTSKLIAFAAAGKKEEKFYIEDVFSTFLYSGTGSSQTVTNGIDLATKGGMVWIKPRNSSNSNCVYDTVRGAGKELNTDNASGAINDLNRLSGFTSTGFTLGSGTSVNSATGTYVSWTFREAPKFFDVVTYTGDGVLGRNIAHNLGSVPGCIIVKKVSSSTNWVVYHRARGAGTFYFLNSSAGASTSGAYWNNTTPTSTVFTVGNDTTVNASGDSYVAYLFAHNAGGFGQNGDQNVITCDQFVTDGNGAATINLGWEPQWILVKRNNAAIGSFVDNWNLLDVSRGLDLSGTSYYTSANLTNSESSAIGAYSIGNTGFTQVVGGDPSVRYIYIAIRRGPMKVPTDATKVFSASTAANDSVNGATTNFLVDALFDLRRGTTSGGSTVLTRITGNKFLSTPSTGVEQSGANRWYDISNGIKAPNIYGDATVYELFGRAPGFFDVVPYTGTGSLRTVAHNLGVVPELIIVKSRTSIQPWCVYSADEYNRSGSVLRLSSSDPASFSFFSRFGELPTSSVFSVASDGETNTNGANYIAYLFATCPGVSKVGSYTGDNSILNIDCGFTNGARFVLIKRTDASAQWLVFDSARGIVSGSDPYLSLNSTDPEVSSDVIDPNPSGFALPSGTFANTNGGSYIFLAIA